MAGERPLGELTENFDSIRVPVKEAGRVPGPYPYYGPSGIVDHVDKFLLDGEYLLIAEDGENLRTRNTPIAFMARGKFWVNNHAHIVRGNRHADTRFLMYALAATDISGYLTGSTMPKLTQGNMNRIPLVAPPLKEQQAIACVLGALDDKIELNRRMNRTLEGLARAIFQSWFVDFDPVRWNRQRQGAKTPGRQADKPKPPLASSRPGGSALDPELAALFPNAFENSELGEIPQGWRVTSLADQITASKGLSYKGQHLCEPGEGLPMHNLNSVYEGGGYKNEGLKWYNGEYRPAHLLKPGDVIVTNTEQGFDHLLIGYAAIVPERHGPRGLYSHHIFRVQPKAASYLPPWFTYLLLRTQRFHDVVAGHSNGTTVNMLPLDGLQKPRFVLPPKAIVEWFARLFMPTQQRLERTHDENISLTTLRDALLPKLISGELRVPDAERIVGRMGS